MPEHNTSPIDRQTAEEAWTKLYFISDILRTTSYSIVGLDYVNFAQFPIIRFFLECPDAAPSMKELIAVSGLSSGALSQAVDALVETGFLKRVSSQTDSRLRMVPPENGLRNGETEETQGKTGPLFRENAG